MLHYCSTKDAKELANERKRLNYQHLTAEANVGPIHDRAGNAAQEWARRCFGSAYNRTDPKKNIVILLVGRLRLIRITDKHVYI